MMANLDAFPIVFEYSPGSVSAGTITLGDGRGSLHRRRCRLRLSAGSRRSAAPSVAGRGQREQPRQSPGLGSLRVSRRPPSSGSRSEVAARPVPVLTKRLGPPLVPGAPIEAPPHVRPRARVRARSRRCPRRCGR
jgi:hypothetical protein